MMKVGILYICTSSYAEFWKGFYTSMEEHFLPGSEKHYFVFTDRSELYDEKQNPRIHRYEQEHLGWPETTLYRYRMFLRAEDALKEMDYILFFNANILCMEDITEEEYLPIDHDLLAVRHMAMYGSAPAKGVRLKNWQLPYERNPESLAAIPWFSLHGTEYCYGGINGGKRDAYLKLIRTLDENIRRDEENHVRAYANDESHFNRYIAYAKSVRLLPTDYGYPEQFHLPCSPKILLLDKARYIPLDDNHEIYHRPKRPGLIWHVPLNLLGIVKRVAGLFHLI